MSRTSVKSSAFVAVLTLIAVFPWESVGQTVQFARWRNNATAAYSLCHDDYGEAWWGDFTFMDSILTNRGLTVSFSTIAGRLDRGDSGRAANYVAKGRRFTTHGYNHVCDTPITLTNANPRYTIAQEYDSARARIERMIPSQGRCLYWQTPCGNQSAENVNWLRTHGFIGCRNDIDGVNPVPYGVPDPFRIGEGCYQPAGAGAAALNSYAQAAIDGGNWASRQSHCVSDNSGLGWAPIPLAEYRAHCDWCKQQIDAGRLWMAPVQTVLMYALERSRWTVSVTSSSATQMQCTIDNDSVINQYVANSLFDVPLTLIAGLPGGWAASEAQVVQNAQVIPHTVVNASTIRFDAAPWGGVVTIYSATSVMLTQPLRVVQPAASRAGAALPMAFGLDGRLVAGSAPGMVLMAAPDGTTGAVRMVLAPNR